MRSATAKKTFFFEQDLNGVSNFAHTGNQWSRVSQAGHRLSVIESGRRGTNHVKKKAGDVAVLHYANQTSWMDIV